MTYTIFGKCGHCGATITVTSEVPRPIYHICKKCGYGVLLTNAKEVLA